MRVLFLLALWTTASSTHAFVAPGKSTRLESTNLAFGIPTFGKKEEDSNSNSKKKDSNKNEQDEKKIGLSGLVQLITAGMGSPFLGDFEGIDEETGNFMFSLEANNLVDEKGESKQTKMPYFESGWVSDEDAEKERNKKGGFRFW
eukprot:CAMPEP_0118694190 /NCGR_PEP_ID=MMETSP0800-20121206/12360_1 /TAXON_ID=210618 ORGANISM="Striatella unipunctata, Strain CCMP2910" /NCGR_SAMPLE_ID=MMETSP0800 /ASSEMBLY_ACC=CAM_ASM_000638 /LENGTH=144 /DNA_ID=CAMNT_0006592577 /DNA_START=145 /DNA_END=576 /DNA_ORIENTATION=+